MTTAIFILLGVLHAPDPDLRVGRVLIAGNTATPNGFILHSLQVHPGQQLDLEKLRRAESRLRASGWFRTNPWRGTGPTVEVLENDFDGRFRDVLVQIEERDGAWILFGIVDAFEATSTDELLASLIRLRWHHDSVK